MRLGQASSQEKWREYRALVHDYLKIRVPELENLQSELEDLARVQSICRSKYLAILLDESLKRTGVPSNSRARRSSTDADKKNFDSMPGSKFRNDNDPEDKEA